MTRDDIFCMNAFPCCRLDCPRNSGYDVCYPNEICDCEIYVEGCPKCVAIWLLKEHKNNKDSGIRKEIDARLKHLINKYRISKINILHSPNRKENLVQLK